MKAKRNPSHFPHIIVESGRKHTTISRVFSGDVVMSLTVLRYPSGAEYMIGTYAIAFRHSLDATSEQAREFLKCLANVNPW